MSIRLRPRPTKYRALAERGEQRRIEFERELHRAGHPLDDDFRRALGLPTRADEKGSDNES